MKPFIFPKKETGPNEMISNALISALSSCTGVIVLDGPFSNQSAWVALERDYAVRLKKPIYTLSSTDGLRNVQLQPLDLRIFAVFVERDAGNPGSLQFA